MAGAPMIAPAAIAELRRNVRRETGLAADLIDGVLFTVIESFPQGCEAFPIRSAQIPIV
ncbi:MAG: hypothetical protein AMXMBFR84_44610 [Candidatus Hydrogenedentota bacterium]